MLVTRRLRYVGLRLRSSVQQQHPHQKQQWQQRRTIFDIPSVPAMMESGLLSFQAATGLPWWATFASSTVMVRALMLPLVRLQIIESQKLAAAMPEYNTLFTLLKERSYYANGMSAGGKIKEFFTFLPVFWAGARAVGVLHNVNFFWILGPPIGNMGFFVSFVYALRRLMQGDGNSADLTSAGLLWFGDLTAKDPTLLLPLIAVCTSYTAIEVAFGSTASAGRVVLLIKDGMQSLLLVALPFIMPLPAGVFCYWIPSSLCGIAQTVLLCTPAARQMLRLPPISKRQLNQSKTTPISSTSSSSSQPSAAARK